MSMITALIINPDGTAKVEEIGTDLDSLRAAIGGGWLEAVYPASDSHGSWVAYVDDEGRLRGMDENPAAAAFAHQIGRGALQMVYGPAVFVGTQDAGDGSLEDADIPPLVLGAAVRLWGVEA